MFYIDILDINHNDNYYELKISPYHSFIINEKIKIFATTGNIYDNVIISIKNTENANIIIIQKNNIILENIINGKICSFKNQLSIIFKTFPLSK